MPQISLETPHKLGREEAVRRLKDKFNVVRALYGAHVTNLQQKWTDHTHSFSFKAMGMGVSGAVQVEDALVKLQVELPLAATLFKGTIEERIRREISGLLE
jgi:hypothetical protein